MVYKTCAPGLEVVIKDDAGGKERVGKLDGRNMAFRAGACWVKEEDEHGNEVRNSYKSTELELKGLFSFCWVEFYSHN